MVGAPDEVPSHVTARPVGLPAVWPRMRRSSAALRSVSSLHAAASQLASAACARTAAVGPRCLSCGRALRATSGLAEHDVSKGAAQGERVHWRRDEASWVTRRLVAVHNRRQAGLVRAARLPRCIGACAKVRTADGAIDAPAADAPPGAVVAGACATRPLATRTVVPGASACSGSLRLRVSAGAGLACASPDKMSRSPSTAASSTLPAALAKNPLGDSGAASAWAPPSAVAASSAARAPSMAARMSPFFSVAGCTRSLLAMSARSDLRMARSWDRGGSCAASNAAVAAGSTSGAAAWHGRRPREARAGRLRSTSGSAHCCWGVGIHHRDCQIVATATRWAPSSRASKASEPQTIIVVAA